MLSGNHRSTIIPSEYGRSPKTEEKPMKTSSIVSTSDTIYGAGSNDHILRKEKNCILK
jgi:hypothetical protein